MHSYIEVTRELRSLKSKTKCTIGNYTLYMLMPTMVYQEEYPRSQRIKKLYVLRKLFEVGVCLMIVIKHTESYWIQSFRSFQNNEGIGNVFMFYLQMVSPIILTYYTIFYFVFELYLNICAEVTRFGDREFYQEFWNITSYSEYGRSWNTITHQFLYQHIFKPCKVWFGMSSVKSGMLTTMFSAVMHDYFVVF